MDALACNPVSLQPVLLLFLRVQTSYYKFSFSFPLNSTCTPGRQNELYIPLAPVGIFANRIPLDWPVNMQPSRPTDFCFYIYNTLSKTLPEENSSHCASKEKLMKRWTKGEVGGEWDGGERLKKVFPMSSWRSTCVRITFARISSPALFPHPYLIFKDGKLPDNLHHRQPNNVNQQIHRTSEKRQKNVVS